MADSSWSLLRLARNDDSNVPVSGQCEIGENGKSDSKFLDAYSRAVITVVEAVGPASSESSPGRTTPNRGSIR